MIDDPLLRAVMMYLEQALASLHRFERDHDVIGDMIAGSTLDLADAADAWQCSDETIRKECEKAAARNQPIGVKHRGRWILGKERFLDFVERSDGRHARLVAEDRLRKRKACA